MKLIDADSLKEYKFTTTHANGLELEDIEVVPVAAIDNAPPVERLQGEWVEKRCIDIGYMIAKCSCCGKWSSLARRDTGYSVEYEHYPFCHWCGADMRFKDELKEAENEFSQN